MDVVPWQAAYGVGGGAIVALLFFGLAFLRSLSRGYDPEGKKHGLVPGSAVAVLVAAERKRGDDYRTLYETADKRATLLEEQIGKTVVKILDALPVPSDAGRTQ